LRPVMSMDAPQTNQLAGNTEAARSPNGARNPPVNPHWQTQQNTPIGPHHSATSAQQNHRHVASPVEVNPPLPSRPKSGAPTNAEKTYNPPSIRRPAEQPAQPSTSRPNASDMFNIPGGFPGLNVPTDDSRASSLHDHSPTVPRRKDVRLEAPLNPQDKSFPAQPSRAPPAPPVLSPPAPPPYYQGKDTQQPTPVSAHDPRTDNFSSAEAAKIQQLVSLGIPRMDAEYLLNRTGGDVNAAAELQLSEMGSLSGPARESNSQGGQPGGFPSPLGSNPVERRNRRSK